MWIEEEFGSHRANYPVEVVFSAGVLSKRLLKQPWLH
jgi:hypothetical protein